MDSKLKKFETSMFLKKKNDLYKFFFNNDSQLQEFPVHIVTDNNERLVPFRNIYCTLPQCIYTIEQIKDRFKLSNYSEKYAFECSICENIISIDKFYLDSTLENEIKLIWDTMNYDEIMIKTIFQTKKGKCVPELPKNISSEKCIILFFWCFIT